MILQITGPGVNATITLNDLQTGQLVTITVNVNGATAEIDSDRRSKGGRNNSRAASSRCRQPLPPATSSSPGGP